MDEMCVHRYTSETKAQLKKWVEAAFPAPKKVKTVQSAGKVMISVFWEAKGILLIDYLEKGKTVTSEYSAFDLNKQNERLVKKDRD